ncbi:MAG: hypothetical protein GX021_09665 [Tissierellia bacterium]|nr:hypothetical protein [Tissierellia bacterium]
MVNPLSRVGMKNIVNKGPIFSSSISRPSISRTGSLSNLDEREEQLLTEIINGQREVVEGISTKKTITLEEAVERIKKNY